MANIHFPTISQQVTTHLRNEIMRGTWVETMPGRTSLIEALGVSGRTIEIALRQLEKEGLLSRQGAVLATLTEGI